MSSLMGCSEGLSPSQDDVFAYTHQTQPEAGTNTQQTLTGRRSSLLSVSDLPASMCVTRVISELSGSEICFSKQII